MPYNSFSLKRLFSFALVLAAAQYSAQINGYAKITAITSNSILTCSNVNTTSGTFVAGGNVIIMQMQDATYGTTNDATFGSLTSLGFSGLYEVATVQALNGTATSFTLTQTLKNSYDAGASLQIITYPNLGTNFTTTANITGLGWNGNVGGVIAFSVTGNLILNHNISADGIGFRGGAKSGQDGGGCETNVWAVNNGDVKYASKGEGIGFRTSNNHRAARAKLINGGGGGIVHNGGGGGGGNYTAGGAGYYGYVGSGYCSVTTNAGGQAGIAVTSSSTRIYMGGGGGGGQENNNVGTNGGDGGGIVLIKCDTIVRPGTCSAHTISANGETAGNAGNDGCGGGGAGGTIVLDVKGFRFTSTCSLNIQANGGNGGSVGSGGSSHGAGGGGGQGAIYVRAAAPFTNVTLATANGVGGNGTTDASPPTAGSGAGTAGSGTNTGQTAIPLPVELKSFKLVAVSATQNNLLWSTLSETNNKEFRIYHSQNGLTWDLLCSVPRNGSNTEPAEFYCQHNDVTPGQHYYKLIQEDFDGATETLGILTNSKDITGTSPFVAPNPCSASFTLYNAKNLTQQSFFISNYLGTSIPIKPWLGNNGSLLFEVTELPAGAYVLHTAGYAFKFNIAR